MTYILLRNLFLSLFISPSFSFSPKQNFAVHIQKEPLLLFKAFIRDGFSRKSFSSRSYLLSSLPNVDDINIRKLSSDTSEKSKKIVPMNWDIFENAFPPRPIASGQKQLPLLERVAKASHEESAPWILTLLFTSLASLFLSDATPFQISCALELSFLILCSVKLFTKFNIPTTTPEPLLSDRDWNYVYNSVWESQKCLSDKRKFVTDWFYDVPFECIRREDAIRFLAWIHFGIQEEHLSTSQRYEIVMKDLPRLEYEVNNGNKFISRKQNEDVLECVRFNLEPLRFRHKPLLFYIVTHGTGLYVRKALKELGFSYTPPKDSKKNLGYFYRPASPSQNKEKSPSTPLVFIHGVGGIAYYFQLIKDLGSKTDSPIILIDLPFISLQVEDNIPSVTNQVQSVCDILDTHLGKSMKATFVGHSFGSLILSWMVQSCPKRVASCVFLDPICFQLHLRNTLFNFHFQRVDQSIQIGKEWQNPFSLGSFINMAGTEMHTNNAMLRHFWWATNALWPEDLEKNKIPASIMVSENDEIVPSAEIERLFLNHNSKLGQKKIKQKLSSLKSNVLLRANMLRGANHGEFVFNDPLRIKVVNNILAMMRLNNITQENKQTQ